MQRKHSSAAVGHHWVCECPPPRSGCFMSSKNHPDLRLHHARPPGCPQGLPLSILPPSDHLQRHLVSTGEMAGVPGPASSRVSEQCSEGFPWGGQVSPNSVQVTSQDSLQ